MDSFEHQFHTVSDELIKYIIPDIVYYLIMPYLSYWNLSSSGLVNTMFNGRSSFF